MSLFNRGCGKHNLGAKRDIEFYFDDTPIFYTLELKPMHTATMSYVARCIDCGVDVNRTDTIRHGDPGFSFLEGFHFKLKEIQSELKPKGIDSPIALELIEEQKNELKSKKEKIDDHNSELRLLLAESDDSRYALIKSYGNIFWKRSKRVQELENELQSKSKKKKKK